MAAPCFDSDYARIYDLIYAKKDYAREVELCVRKMDLAGKKGPILDYGCGTGNHAAAWIEQGYQITGLDINDTMLDIARSKQLGQAVNWLNSAEIGNLKSGSFDGVCMLFDVLSYLPSDAAIRELMGHFHRLLKSDRFFLFDFWYEPAVLHLKPEVRTAHFQDEFMQVQRIARPTHFSNGKSIRVDYEITVHANEHEMYFEESHQMRYFTQDAAVGFLESAGFESAEFFTWENPNGEPTHEDWSIACLARKGERP